MSEWGNPALVMRSQLVAEYIGNQQRTRGSETSQYLQEEKTNVISGVAASEMERAQTAVHAQRGYRTSNVDLTKIAERFWKSRPKGVKAS